MRTRTLRYSLAAGVLVALTGLAGCSGGGGGTSGASSSADAGAPEPANGVRGLAEGSRPADRGDADSGSPGVSRASVRTTAVLRTGEIALTGKDLSKVRAEVDGLLAAVGGTIDDEQTTNDRDGRIDRSTLVLRVPVDRFRAAKDALERLGTLKSSTESAKDVTTEVIDVAERVETLQNSLDRLQRFQRSARDVRDLIRFEEDITRRQAELQSLKAQQAYLSDQTSMSTITLRLATPATYVAPRGALDDAGFLAGLKGGWQALVGFGLVVLTVAGALLPFLVAGTLVGVPAWLALRALLRRRRAGSATPVTDRA
jgi:hypothetical protein